MTDLSAQQVGPGIELSFTLPTTATDGELLTKPIEVEFSRVITPAGAGAPQAPGAWTAVPAADLARAAGAEKIDLSEGLSPAEYRRLLGASITFWIRTLTRGFRNRPIESELSNAVRVALLAVSAPPEGLRVTPAEHALRLTWAAPAISLIGRPLDDLAGYRIYRSETGAPESFRPVGESPRPAYDDRSFQFGASYFYRVRALFKRGAETAESEDSTAVSITPRDVFPPLAPTRLSAVYAAGAVELIWNANTEPDLAGYNVYRSEQGAPPRKVNADLVRTPVYRDASVEPGRRYEYRVTAVDLSGNESAASETARIETR